MNRLLLGFLKTLPASLRDATTFLAPPPRIPVLVAPKNGAPSPFILGYFPVVPTALALSVRQQFSHYLALRPDREFSNIEPRAYDASLKEAVTRG
jgi:hypothetical protein